ncbi:zona pellucida sperm-binding protein 1 isoform X2 [Phascolarctos cinereus]|uniref:Zona pellucida sperm-binding protein 1 n=1 Tax=Phascolarctos cinereus TaxID=38626 RepID=A0A6P5JL47_PHACI|nr:zona pellucida sperm-binding protein 1 [Phascolarctos cinereus]
MGPASQLGGLTMGWGTCLKYLLLLVLLLGLDQRPGAWGLQLSHECGSYGMQLLAFPRPGQAIRFKVVDEFGSRFDVTNCSICLHWVTSEPQGPTIFSAGYHGCHVMEKDGQYHLGVFVEAMLGTQLDETQNVTLICPKAEHPKSPGPPPSPRPVFQPSPSPAWLRPPPHLRPFHLDLRHLSLSSADDGDHQPARIRPTWSSPSSSPVTLVHQLSPYHTGNPLSREQCQVVSGRIPCAEGARLEACLQAGCCYDDTDAKVPCYYGDTATVQCFEDGHFVLVVSQNTTSEKQVGLQNIKLAYASGGCTPTQRTGNFVVFHFPVTQCGTTIQLANNQLVYENQLVSDIDVQTGPAGAITRDSTFLLHVRCIYNASSFLPLQMEVFLRPPPAPVLGSGPLHLELRIARDQKYRSYYHVEDYPIFKMLREAIHVEVRLLGRKDPNLVLVLHHCWATPSSNPIKEPQWPLLFDGCPFAGDGYKTRLAPMEGTSDHPFSTHYQRFVVSTFTFVDSVSQRALSGPVYFFCSASACYPSETETCRAVCHPGTTKQRRFVDGHSYMEGVQDIVGSPGPVGFGNSSEQKINLQNKASPSKERSAVLRPNVLEPLLPERSSWNMTLKPLLWVTFSLVVIAVLLVVAALLGRSQKAQEQSRVCVNKSEC